ncbi:hypothetical protein DHW03_02665 [Pedobacter yonginense]|uniref:Uncharacterized protein n=2 Tax=Pedobacter yonginense TaxID=651869 RepID=A0A317EQK1_9SPHI|nr:hypothetical protein DHW03_02665 [Pedobacter yonginense]
MQSSIPMPNKKIKTVMLFKLSSEKINELNQFIDTDSKSLILLTSVQNISSGAVFEEKNNLDVLLEELEKAG